VSTWKSLTAVCVGVILGRLLHPTLAAALTDLLKVFQPSPLAANLLTALFVGAIAFVAALRGFPLEWPLFLLTGFCAGVLRFSPAAVTFVTLWEQHRWEVLAGDIAIHVLGSVCMTILGYRQALTIVRMRPRQKS
jgi:fluoride exporter